MRKHIYILLLTFLVIVIDCILFIYANKNDLFVDKSILISSLFSMVLAVFFPMSIFTCYHLVVDDNKKGHFLARLIEGIHGECLGGLLIVPFLLAPFFIYDYILYLIADIADFKKMKNAINAQEEKSEAKYEDKKIWQ